MSTSPRTGSSASESRRSEREAATEVWEWGPFLRKRWKSIAAVTILTMAVTMVVTFLIAPSYQSIATLAIQPLTISDPFGFSASAQLNARNVGELLKSPAVAARAAKSLGKAELSGKFEYRVPEFSGLVEIIAVAGSPQDASDEANAVAEALIASNSDSLQTNAKRVQGNLEKQLGDLRTQVVKTQNELAAARNVPDGAAKVGELQDRLDSTQTAYQNLLQQTQILPSSQAAVSAAVMLADRAIPEPRAVNPKPFLNLVLSFVGGLLLGIASARATEPRAEGRETGD